MVDIIPYTSDDEDQTNWVPLTSSVSNPTSSNATAASSSEEDTNTKQNEAMKVNSDIATPNKEVYKDDIVFVEDVNNEENEGDEDQDWQTISSSSPPPTTQQHTTQIMQSTADAPSLQQQWSWGQQLITHLTTTTTPQTNSNSELKVEDGNISDAEEEDNIVWNKPNSIQDDNIERIRVKRDEREQFDRKKLVEEEYTDISSSTKKQKNKIVAPMKQLKQLPTTSVEEDTDEEEVVWQKPNEETTFRQEQTKKKSSPPQFKHIPSQSKPQPKTSTNHQTPLDEQRSGQQTIKTKLQQTLIHDPLYSLPFCFLKHLYYETKLQIIHTYTVYFEQHELSHILAPLLLVGIIALFGLTLIVMGLYNLGTLLIQGVVHGSVSFGNWLMNYSLSMAGTIVWWSLCSSVLLGIGIWIWSKVKDRKATTNEKSSFHVPSISTMLPWTIALSATSFYEAIVILFSLRIYLSVLTTDNVMIEDICTVDEDQYCLLPGTFDQSISSMSSLSTCILVIILAAVNVLVVSVAANILDHEDTSQVKTNQAKTASFKSYKQIQKHLPACHIISIATLVVMSILTLLMQALYAHYLQQGGNVLYTLVNQLGTVGYNTVCIGVGVFTLVTLWNVTMSSIATNDTILGISYGEISRVALKQSIIEISSRAVWSDTDMGSSLLGILSDNDGALRLAILEWIIDRWATSKSDEKPNPSSSTTRPDSSPPSATNENTDTNNTDSSQDKDSSKDSPTFQGQTKQSTEGSSSFTPPNNSSTSSQVLPSYQSLQAVIARLDADETLIPTIKRYRMWVYSLPPSRNAAVCVALWKLCPAMAIMSLWIGVTSIAQLCMLILSSFDVLSTQSSTGLFGVGILGIMSTLLSPILCIEYLQVSQWWAKNNVSTKEV